MQLITAEGGQLRKVLAAQAAVQRDRAFTTGLPAWDALAPGGAFQRGAIHELLSDTPDYRPLFIAALMAIGSIDVERHEGVRKARRHGGTETQRPEEGTKARRHEGTEESFPLRAFVPSCLLPSPSCLPLAWLDPERTLYPPALVGMGVPLDRLLIVRPTTPAEVHWAAAECLRCRGVGATIACFGRLSRIEARRLQLAAEAGGGIGIFLRPAGQAAVYAAATRWLVRPHPGEPTIQRWSLRLVHGHGGRVGETVFLEQDRENHTVRATAELADRSRQPATEAVGVA